MKQIKTQTNFINEVERAILLEKKHELETDLYAKSVFLNEYSGTGDFFSESFIAKIESDIIENRRLIEICEAKLKLRAA